jgi:SAM-dependent methyltransferase
MVALAEQELAVPDRRVIWSSIEQWDYPPDSFDIVLSRLALHYVDDLAPVFQNVHQSLTTGGRFIFCVEHPVITSCNRSRGESGDDTRQDWIVDDYFVTGKREVKWLGKQVTKYHHTIEEYFALLQKANFTVTHLRESRPMPHRFADEALFQRRNRIPLFLFLAGQRAGA